MNPAKVKIILIYIYTFKPMSYIRQKNLVKITARNVTFEDLHPNG